MNPKTLFMIWNLKTQMTSILVDGINLLCGQVSETKALAAAKKIRDKYGAKKAAKAQGFTFLDELEQHKTKCMINNECQHH